MIKKYIRKMMYEILKEPELKIELSKYIIKHTPSKMLNAFDIMKSPYCYEIKLKVEYIDSEQNIKMVRHIEKPPSEFFGALNKIDTKIPGTITDINLYARYKYKGEEKLESHSFTGYSNKRYSPDILVEVKNELMSWYNEHPELKLWQK